MTEITVPEHPPKTKDQTIHIVLSLLPPRFLRDLEITGPSGEHLPYWDQISYTRFLFDFW